MTPHLRNQRTRLGVAWLLLLASGGAASAQNSRAEPAAAASVTTLRLRDGGTTRAVAPHANITVSFDRAVVADTAMTRDAAAATFPELRVTPALSYRTVWRDPLTVRIVPLEPLRPGVTYTVIVDTPFVAADGARLLAIDSIRARVTEVQRRAIVPELRAESAAILPPDGRLLLRLSGEIDPMRWARAVSLDILPDSTCPARSIAFTLREQRKPRAGEHPTDVFRRQIGERTRVDTLDRVLEYRPVDTLPIDCRGVLSVPDAQLGPAGGVDRYPVRTAPEFAIRPAPPCAPRLCAAPGVARLDFTTPLASGSSFTADVGDGPRRHGAQWGTVLSYRLPTSARSRDTLRVRVGDDVRDVYGRTLRGERAWSVVIPDREPGVSFAESGYRIRPRAGAHSIRVHHVNVRRVEVRAVRLAEDALTSRLADLRLLDAAPDHLPVPTIGDTVRVVHVVPSTLNEEQVSNLPLPAVVHRVPGQVWRVSVHVLEPRADLRYTRSPFAQATGWRADGAAVLLAYSDLMVHARLFGTPSSALVTHARTGAPVAGATVMLRGEGNARLAEATTSENGTATFALTASVREWEQQRVAARSLMVALPDDTLQIPLQALSTGLIGSSAFYDLRPTGSTTEAFARALLYTERDLYRAGDLLYFGAISQRLTGATFRPESAARHRWRLEYAPLERWPLLPLDSGEFRLTEAGTASDSVRLPPELPPSTLYLSMFALVDRDWRVVARHTARIGEYRTPEFLVQVDTAPAITDRIGRASFEVAAAYLYRAPMRGADAEWHVSLRDAPGAHRLLGLASGEAVGPWNAASFGVPLAPAAYSQRSGDGPTLDADGRIRITADVSDSVHQRPVAAHLDVTIADVNRQEVSAYGDQVVHPSSLYLAARREGPPLRPGDTARVLVRPVSVLGDRPAPRMVEVALVRWRRTARRRDGASADAEWRSTSPLDTTWRESVRVDAASRELRVPVPTEGVFELTMRTRDDAKRRVVTSLGMVVDPASPRRAATAVPAPGPALLRVPSTLVRAGDDVTVAFDSPFADAEAWLTLEREGVRWQWRQRVGAGTHAVRVPTNNVPAPGGQLSLLLVRRFGDTLAAPHTLPDTLRWRSATAALRLDSSQLLLRVAIAPTQERWRPRDTAAVDVSVRTLDGTGAPARVSVWAVDEGQLSLTDYSGPAPVSAFMARTASWMRMFTALEFAVGAGAVPTLLQALRTAWFLPIEGDFSGRGVRGGIAAGAPLSLRMSTVDAPVADFERSDLRPTAFFVANAITDSSGRVRVRAPLPDGITRYRLFAVAADTAGRVGNDTASLQVTQPLVLRAALPRFVRPGDAFTAGGVIAVADAVEREVVVDASGSGVRTSDRARPFTASATAQEVVFRWQVPDDGRDSARHASITLRATGRDASDAVRTSLPVEPETRARRVVRATRLDRSDTITIVVPADLDVEAGTVTLTAGASLEAVRDALHERADRMTGSTLEELASRLHIMAAIAPSDAGDVMRPLVRSLVARASAEDGVSYWPGIPYSTPWLTAWATSAVLAARDAGVSVDSGSFGPMLRYLQSHAADTSLLAFGARTQQNWRAARVASTDLARASTLRALGQPDTVLEQVVAARQDALPWEELPVLAALHHAAGRTEAARTVLRRAWLAVGRRSASLELPESRTGADIPALLRGAARLYVQTRHLEPDHPDLPRLLSQIIEGVSEGLNSHDAAWVAIAIAAAPSIPALVERDRGARLRIGNADGSWSRDTALRATPAQRAYGDRRAGDGRLVVSSQPFIVSRTNDGNGIILRLVLDSESPGFALLTVDAPLKRRGEGSRSSAPVGDGFRIERSITRVRDGRPVTSVSAGELVRVTLDVYTPAARDFVIVEDALPAGFEVVDPTLLTTTSWVDLLRSARDATEDDPELESDDTVLPLNRAPGVRWPTWMFRELRTAVVRFHARTLWAGSHRLSYLARATTPGTFTRPPALVETQFDRGIFAWTEGGVLRIR